MFGSDNCPYARANGSSQREQDVDAIMTCDGARAMSLRARRDAVDASMRADLCSCARVKFQYC